MINPGIQLVFNSEKNDIDEKAKFPDLEMIESYVLNLRFFIQDSEAISLNNLSKIYEENCTEKELKEYFSCKRKILNDELNKDWPFMFNNEKMTYQNIFEGMIYCKLAHSNKRKHFLFSEMTKDKLGYYLALEAFLRCINLIHRTLEAINYINKKAFS